ncbi:MAG: hypothetical protein RBT34_13120 [Anaerolineaceae bacterium]|nr:hypothetical protein [Anaerolineaceae bacterium]
MFIGEKLQSVAFMDAKQMENESWGECLPHQYPICITFESAILFPSQDPEGNGPGAISVKFPADQDVHTADLDDLKALIGIKVKCPVFRGDSTIPGIKFEDGSMLFPESDPELNDEGIFFGTNLLTGDPFYFYSIRED